MKAPTLHVLHCLFLFCFALIVSACQFHLQGEVPLAPPLHQLYLQTSDPYGNLANYLKQNLKMSNVHLAATPTDAQTILVILSDNSSQEMLSVGATQQTRQYRLSVTVQFEITNTKGMTIVPAQTITDSRVITEQSNQILGSSNEANLFYQQMRRGIAQSIMTRIASNSVTQAVNDAFSTNTKHKKP